MVVWKRSSIVPTGSNSWNAVAYGNGMFVAVGANIMTSSDGDTWTQRTLPFTKPTSWTGFTCITYGNNEFLAIAGKYVIRSPNGINWTYISISDDLGLNNNWTSVTYYSNTYVAVSNSVVNQRIMRSTDGVNWSPPSYWPIVANVWTGVTSANGMHITVGSNETAATNILYSADSGLTWRYDNMYKSPFRDTGFNAVTNGNGKFVALGNKYVAVVNDVFTSSKSWNLYTLPTKQSCDWRSLAYSNGLYVATCKINATGYQSMVSSDLITWSTLATPINSLTSIASGNGLFVAVSSSGTAMVASDTETPTLGSFTIPSQQYSNSSFSINSPTSNSSGAWTYNSSNPNVATISGSKIKIIGIGSATITATQAATSSYSSASTTTTFTVTQATTIMGTLSLPAKNYGDSAFTLTKPTTTNPDTSITYSSNNASVATISGNVVTITGIGSATITASQLASTNYSSASTSALLTVSKGVTTIGTFSFSPRTYGDAAFKFNNPTSNSSGTFTYTSSNSWIASVSGNQITIIGAGTVTITCTQSATTNFGSATKTATLIVNKATPTITGFNNINKYYGDAAFYFSNVISNSPGAITYTSSNISVASINGTTVSIGNVGVATITLTQDESTNYLKTIITATLTVNRANPNLGALLLPPSIPYSNNSSFNLTIPTSLSSSAFYFTSTETSVATIGTGSLYNILQIVGVGTSTIIATQNESTNFASASVSALLTVSKGTPNIGSIQLPSSIAFGDSPYTISDPTSASTGMFTYSILDTSIATISNKTITFLKPGETFLICEQSETTNYFSAYLSVGLTVSKGNPIIGSIQLPSSIAFGDSPYTISDPTSASTGMFTYSILDTSIATISNKTITFLKPGETFLICEQSETTYYSPASRLVLLTVSKATPDIGSLQLSYGILGDIPFEIDDPTSNSSGPFSYASSNNSVATIFGKTLTIVGQGITSIILTQYETDYYTSKSVTVNFEVVEASTTLSYTVNNDTPPSVNATYPPYQDEYIAISPSIIANGITYPVTTISNGAFSNCLYLKRVILPYTINTISTRAFSNCTSLTSIIIPNTVTQINDNTFIRCSSLTSFTLPNSITYIAENAFANCINLTSVTLSKSLTTIGPYAFDNCRRLTSITIPSSVTTIGNGAFGDIYNLSIYFESTSNLPTFIFTTTSIGYLQMKAYYKEGVKTPSGGIDVTSYLLGLGFKTVQTY